MNDVFELCGLIDFQRAKTADLATAVGGLRTMAQAAGGGLRGAGKALGQAAGRVAGDAASLATPTNLGAATAHAGRLAAGAAAAPAAAAGAAGRGFAAGLKGDVAGAAAAAPKAPAVDPAAKAKAQLRAGNAAGRSVGKQWGIGTGAGRFLTNMTAGRAAGLSALAGGAVSLLTKDKDESALGAAAGGALKGMALGTPALLGARSLARGAGGYNVRPARSGQSAPSAASKADASAAPAFRTLGQGAEQPAAGPTRFHPLSDAQQHQRNMAAAAAKRPAPATAPSGVPGLTDADIQNLVDQLTGKTVHAEYQPMRKIALGPTPPKLITDLRRPTALQPKGSPDLLSNKGKDLLGKPLTERTPSLAPGERLLSEKGQGIFHGAEKIASLAGGDFYVFLLADGASFIGEYAGRHSDETMKVAIHLPGVAPEMCLLDIADVADLRPLVKQANGLPINRREDVIESVEGQKLAAAYIEMQKEAKAPAKDTSNTDEKATSKKPPFEVPALKAKLTSAGLAR